MDVVVKSTGTADQDQQQVVRCMPKVELHAHLNGSIGDELLEHLKCFGENDKVEGMQFPGLDEQGVLMPSLLEPPTKDIPLESCDCDTTSLNECWVAFGRIHRVIQTPRILFVATVNVIAEFARDKVIYLELRTGPKKVNEIGSKEDYLETVVQAIIAARQRFPEIVVKLLVSVNRGNGEEDAYQNVKLAKEMRDKHPDVVMGLDVSGDPAKGRLNWIVGVMQEARKEGLKISCHLPEILNPEESLAFMKFGPERVGHGQFLHPLYGGTLELWEVAKKKRIPVEVCVSSNLVSSVASALDKHVVIQLHAEGLPFVVCTDDSGVFKTSLSQEFLKILSVIPLDTRQLKDLNLQAVNYSFASCEEKAELKNKLVTYWNDQL